MSARNQKEKTKSVQDKYQMILSRLLREEDNKYCADCDAKGPRWASWNLGIFLCIRCAGIHRNLGVHISRVKSVNLDTWTEEQIMSVENGGNTLGRRIYEKHLPTDFRRPSTDSSSLENFIRCKYDSKKYMDKEFVRPAPKKLQDRDFETVEKKEKKNSSSSRHSKQQTLVSLAKARETRPHASGLQPSMAASLSSTLSQSSPNLAADSQQPPATLTSTPVKAVASANDLLGLCTPPANNMNDLLGLDTPTTSSSGNPSVTSNGTPEGAVEPSLFGDDAEGAGQGGKKTKDSIMALFASSSGQQQQQPAYNVPGGVYIPSQKQQQQPFVANGFPANSSMPGYQAPAQQQQQQQQMPQQLQAGYQLPQQQQQQQPGMTQPGYSMMNNQRMMGNQPGMMGNQQGMMGNQPGMMGNQQGMMGNQPGMMGNQQGMMGNQPAMMGNQQGMMGNQPAMMGNQPAMMGNQPGMMGNQQGMMGMQGMYPNQGAQQQTAYLQQQQQQQPQQQQQQQPTPQQQQQFQMMQQQMTQQIQQQMSSMRVGGATNTTPPGQVQQPNWQQSNTVLPQQQAVPSAGWGGAGSGQTLSNQLWK